MASLYTFTGKNVFVTGCSKGIGRQLAYQIGTTQQPQNLIILARTGELLEELKQEISEKNSSVKIFVVECDLSKLDSVKSMLRDLEGKVPYVDILVNNAGYFDFNLFDKESWEDINFELQVNVIALTYLTHHFVPKMVARHSGSIINISSAAGILQHPGSAAYNGTKHFVHGLSECLRMELEDTGVSITEVNPGPVQTEGWDTSSELIHNKSWFDGILKTFPLTQIISADQCASDIISGYQKGRLMVYPGWVHSMNMFMSNAIPTPVIRTIGSWFGKKIRTNKYPSSIPSDSSASGSEKPAA